MLVKDRFNQVNMPNDHYKCFSNIVRSITREVADISKISNAAMDPLLRVQQFQLALLNDLYDKQTDKCHGGHWALSVFVFIRVTTIFQ